ncbi:MAG: hypothetical protein WC307_06660 [Candidatus Nanoarchaeia archaeon]|jgi:hypothetical protein
MKVISNEVYTSLKHKASFFDEIAFPFVVTKDDLTRIPLRCPVCRKKVRDYSFKFNETGIGVVTLLINHCLHAIDITDYECW